MASWIVNLRDATEYLKRSDIGGLQKAALNMFLYILDEIFFKHIHNYTNFDIHFLSYKICLHMTINKGLLTLEDQYAICEGSQLVMQRYYQQQLAKGKAQGEQNESLQNVANENDNAMVIFFRCKKFFVHFVFIF
jgi:hypothetical protein